MARKYQTLREFVAKPFNKPSSSTDIKYLSMYNNFKYRRNIKLVNCMVLDDSYYLRVDVPSESSDGKVNYNVVIRFFTDEDYNIKDSHIRNYYIQFFSNSPSFIYKYAYVYRQEGFLIESLQDKLGSEATTKAPEKTNAGGDVYYDKSIFFACQYLLENESKFLNKHGYLSVIKKSPKNFLSDISDFKSLSLDQELLKEEKKLEEALKKDKTKRESIKDRKRSHEKLMNDDSSPGITVVKKKGGKTKIIAKKRLPKIVGKRKIK